MQVFRLQPARTIYALLLTFGSVQYAFAQGMGGGGPAVAPLPDVDEESLIFTLPDKWYPFSHSTDNKDETFVFPVGQDAQDWDETFRIEQFFTTLGVTSGKQIVDVKTEANAGTCADYEYTVEREEPENGYSMAQWYESCDLGNGSSRFVLSKVIVGADRLYIVSKVWLEEPRERDIERWQQVIGRVYVCDPNTGTNPCRPPGGAGAGGRRPR